MSRHPAVISLFSETGTAKYQKVDPDLFFAHVRGDLGRYGTIRPFLTLPRFPLRERVLTSRSRRWRVRAARQGITGPATSHACPV